MSRHRKQIRPTSGKRREFWTAAEDHIVRSNDTEEAIRLLPRRSAKAVRQRRLDLGVAPPRPKWSRAELRVLKANAHKKLAEIVRLLPGRSVLAISNKRALLVSPKPYAKDWTNRQVEALVRLWPDGSRHDLLNETKRSWQAIQHKAHQMGLVRRRRVIADPSHDTPRDALRRRALADGITMQGLTKNIGLPPYTFQPRHQRHLRLDDFVKAVAFFGGSVVVDWNDR